MKNSLFRRPATFSVVIPALLNAKCHCGSTYGELMTGLAMTASGISPAPADGPEVAHPARSVTPLIEPRQLIRPERIRGRSVHAHRSLLEGRAHLLALDASLVERVDLDEVGGASGESAVAHRIDMQSDHAHVFSLRALV